MANALQAIYKWAVPLAVGASVAQAAMYDVKGGTRAVIFDRLSGVRENVVNEGTHFLVPWLQRAIIYDVRTKPRNISTTTGSKDLQMVSLTLRVLHRPEVKMLPRIYQNLGTDYDERVLPSIGNEVLKAIVAQFDAAELITQREAVSNRIRTDLLKRAQEFNIALEDVSITHMTFGKEFTKAVEEKQIAQQEAERARFIVEKAEQERQANVIRAEGEAEAADTISKAVAKSGDGLIQIRRIETQKEIAQMLAANPQVTYLPSGSKGSGEGQGGNFLLGLRSEWILLFYAKAFGTNYGLTAKLPKDSFKYTQGTPKEHVADNGSGTMLHREFCDNCGSFILEYGEPAKNDFRYICVGSLDDPEALAPKGEFFCKSRSSWMPEVPGTFQKKEIKE
ncbi:Prohibitin [Macrophomina phaseolina MS6]|uniref:Prohibitin n=2 Tax=Macrophomina phaseolina TaxID=35725 RepID=K2SFN6_MACPH|nr:Prohibitin [Macrophomina phaseolina MS6]